MIRWSNVKGDLPHTANRVVWDTHAGPSIYRGTRTDDTPYNIIRCIPCQFNHIVPLPSNQALESYYEQTFYKESKPDYVERYEADREWWLHTHTATMAPYVHPKTLFLDIGCGPGIALDAAQHLGASTHGIEVDHNRALELSRRHWMARCTLRDYAPTHLGDVDVAYAWEVLEHVRDPDEFMSDVWDILSPGGYVIIEVPNDFSPLQYQAMTHLGTKTPWWVAPDEHLSYFNVQDLKCLVRRHGFNLVDVRGTYPMEYWLLDDQNYLADPDIGRRCHHHRVARELRSYGQGPAGVQSLFQSYRAAIEDHDVGREIVVVAQKHKE
jgi:SAM-dependent methyltransferase